MTMLLRNYRIYRIRYRIMHKWWYRDEDGNAVGDPKWSYLRQRDTALADNSIMANIIAPSRSLAEATLRAQYAWGFDDSNAHARAHYKEFEILDIVEEEIDYIVEVSSH